MFYPIPRMESIKAYLHLKYIGFDRVFEFGDIRLE